MNDAGKVAFTPKGVFDSAVTYEYLDTVQFGGNCYAARKTTTGNVPPTTGSYVDDNWAVLVVGGASVPIATIDVAGLVKSGDDIGVDSTGEMILKTDFTEQTDLAELTGTEDRKTFFGKIAKAVSTLISHIGTSATADKAGHVKLSSSSAVTDSAGLALPATEKNASLDGTLANKIDTLNKSFATSLQYSTADAVPCDTWTNGKPIYRRTFNFASSTLDLTSCAIERLVKVEGTVTNKDGYQYPISYCSAAAIESNISWRYKDNVLYLLTGSNIVPVSTIVTVYFTRTS